MKIKVWVVTLHDQNGTSVEVFTAENLATEACSDYVENMLCYWFGDDEKAAVKIELLGWRANYDWLTEQADFQDTLGLTKHEIEVSL